MDKWHIGDPVDWGDGWMDAQNWGRSYDDDERYDDSSDVKFEANQKISRAQYIINSEMSYDNANLCQAMSILNETNDKIDACLRQGRVREEVGLKILQNEITELKEKIRMKTDRNDKSRHEKKKREKRRKKSIQIMVSNIEFGNELPIFKLVREDENTIVAYQENNVVGLVSNDLSERDLMNYSNACELTDIPEVSYAKTFMSILCHDNHEFPKLVSAHLIDESQMKEEYELITKQKNILKKYAKARLITIDRKGFYDWLELKEGMKLKLIKESDNADDRDAIAVYLDDSKIGYVANNQKTNCRFTSMASELKPIRDKSSAEYLMNYAGRYHIARR